MCFSDLLACPEIAKQATPLNKIFSLAVAQGLRLRAPARFRLMTLAEVLPTALPSRCRSALVSLGMRRNRPHARFLLPLFFYTVHYIQKCLKQDFFVYSLLGNSLHFSLFLNYFAHPSSSSIKNSYPH